MTYEKLLLHHWTSQLDLCTVSACFKGWKFPCWPEISHWRGVKSGIDMETSNPWLIHIHEMVQPIYISIPHIAKQVKSLILQRLEFLISIPDSATITVLCFAVLHCAMQHYSVLHYFALHCIQNFILTWNKGEWGLRVPGFFVFSAPLFCCSLASQH